MEEFLALGSVVGRPMARPVQLIIKQNIKRKNKNKNKDKIKTNEKRCLKFEFWRGKLLYSSNACPDSSNEQCSI